jgi:hypothetical protein
MPSQSKSYEHSYVRRTHAPLFASLVLWFFPSLRSPAPTGDHYPGVHCLSLGRIWKNDNTMKGGHFRMHNAMAAKRLRVRQDASQTASASKPSPKQPTTTIVLSTTFTPAASCASNKLTMLPPPGYFIWANEPVPVANTTVTNCYPSEFLQSYTSIASGVDQSSIVPVMSPLVCPQNFCTQFVADANYVACCPLYVDLL